MRTDKERARIREYRRNRRDKKKREFFEGKYCEWCSSSSSKLELHHIDGETKRDNIKWQNSNKWIEEELAKCIVLCRKCHRGYHGTLLNKPLVHGTLAGYNKYRCRCPACKEAASIARREYYRRPGVADRWKKGGRYDYSER